jgi:hypothetical protein
VQRVASRYTDYAIHAPLYNSLPEEYYNIYFSDLTILVLTEDLDFLKLLLSFENGERRPEDILFLA